MKLAGRVVYKSEKGPKQKLVHIDKPITRISTLCVHLLHEQLKKIELNLENHLPPILNITPKGEKVEEVKGIYKRHHVKLVDAVARELGIDSESILDFELCLADYQPGLIGGLDEEFIHAPRLDNLLSSYCALDSLINCDGTLDNDKCCRVVMIFDHEEIGSRSAQGADQA